ncbi:MAG TPA: ATP-dependent helicase HrpB [Gemmatimonadaceae bacterium]|nr:ATP-dependent helicase HrpB [Gemmatimonadaceae bacterium]
MLPIVPVLPALLAALEESGVAVLQAPPGAGKTTRVPLALLDAPWLAGRKVLMLEPRRIAARAAARFMAGTLGERVGDTVGYRIRRDTRVGPRTRIEIVTEGVLTRMLQHDPALEDVGVVIFDEFHERSLNADLGLALALQSRALLRDDLRLVVMSATLDGGPVASLIGGERAAPVITSEGRAHPVETVYAPRQRDQWLEPEVARVVRRAITEHEGDVLVFLPGAAEIARVGRILTDAGLPPGTYVAPLHGTLEQQAQDLAIAPSVPGERKIVLATTIAQTSLTIEGVRVVVDCGLARAPRFSPRSGMTRLETVRISAAGAEQRRGRAGRVAPGVCYRMWDPHEQQGLVPFDRPEILEADLAPLALELAAAGVTDPAELRWLDAPPAPALAQARELLRELEALDDAGRITAHGRAMAALPTHPRIAHLLLRAKEQGATAAATACDLAALLEQRDLLRFGGGEGNAADVDIRLRLEVLRDLAARATLPPQLHGATVDVAAARLALTESREWRRALGIPPQAVSDAAHGGALLMLAYPERVAQRRATAGRATARYLLRSGAGVAISGAQSLGDAEYLAVADVGGTGADARIFAAAPVTLAEIESAFAEQIVEDAHIGWDPDARAVRARRRTRLGALVLREGGLHDPDPAAVGAALVSGIRALGLEALPWSDAARSLRARLAFAHATDPVWPDVSDDALLATLEDWLLPHATGVTTLARMDVLPALEGMLSWSQRQQLERYAPTHWEVPSGSRIRIDYADPTAPVLAVRLQEVFGLHDTPRIAGGRVPLTVHLLSPAHRPVQVTQDLAGFWRGSYFDVKKELKGRYPKHYWPDDPLVAEARRGVKR